MIRNFSFAASPQLHFGAGAISRLPAEAKRFGSRVLLVTGARSFESSGAGQKLREEFYRADIHVETFPILKEPSPAVIDEAVRKYSSFAPDCLVAIGGGSALDAGKAISAMLPLQEPVKDYLEGVGTKPTHPGLKIPFIAVPTTSGTGSEATKNAVISETGENGYKRSLRHDNFVPNLAIVDPSLTLNCPADTTASSGMDAFTQLLESYLSTASNPVTDALALEGLKCIPGALLTAFREGANLEARTGMAFASYLSGLTLANAGLGLVHGFASPLGGFFEIPHGVICSALMTSANRVTVRKLRATGSNPEAIRKFALVGKLFSREEHRADGYYTDCLIASIESMAHEMKIPGLAAFGVKPGHFDKIISGTSNKNHPLNLDRDEMREVLETS